MSDDEVTLWINRLQKGDDRAPEVIFQAYFEKLVRLARRRFGGMPRRAVDEEDVALSAMNSFFRAAEAGRFSQLKDREDLWKLVVTIVARKAMKQQRRHFADKRGGGNVRGESAFASREDQSRGIEQVLGKEPTEELADQVACTSKELIEELEDEKLATIALYKLEGYTNDEIAEKLDCTTRTVERKLARIRKKWSAAGEIAE